MKRLFTLFVLICLAFSFSKKKRSVVDFHSRAEEAKKVPSSSIKGNSKIFAPRFLKKAMDKKSKSFRFYEKSSTFESLQRSARKIEQIDPIIEPPMKFPVSRFENIDFEIIPKLSLKLAVKELPETLYEASIVFDGKNSMILHPEFQPSPVKGSVLCASARFTKSIDSIGWDRLYLKSYKECSPVIQMWANGFLEGLLTSKDIFNFYDNLVAMESFSDPKILENLNKFFSAVESNIRKKITNERLKRYSDETALFYTHIALSQIQTDGLNVGINFNSKRQMTMNELFLINADGQVPEFAVLFKDYPFPKQARSRFMHSQEEINKFDKLKLFQRFNTTDMNTLFMKISAMGHCSVLLKLLRDEEGNISDLLASHSTWDEYSEMIRVFKKYDFELAGKASKIAALKPNHVIFSSYPGVMISTDDYYVTNKNLLVMETSLEMLNDKLFDNMVSEDHYVPDYMRLTYANRFSKTPKEWIQRLSFLNTGTYNSQWFVLDMQAISTAKGKTELPRESIMMVEQIPGSIYFVDITRNIEQVGYWASYNIPFLEEVRKRTGYESLEQEKGGELFSFYRNPRAVIFKAREKFVKGLADMKNLMEYNPWKPDGKFDENDPDNPIYDNPAYAIGARFDLIDNPELRKDVGAVDTKIINLGLYSKGETLAISGPSHQDQPVFDFKTRGETMPKGMPSRWNFDWVKVDDEFLEGLNWK